MAYLIDTDIVIDHLAREPAAVELLNRLTTTGFSISIVTYIEVVQGILLEPDPTASREVFASFLDDVPLAPLSREVADRCASIRAELVRRKRRVRSRALDLIIAATAIEHGLTLVTRNTDDYKDIPGLTLH